MMSNLQLKSLVWLLIALTLFLAGCQLGAQDYSEISQVFNLEKFEFIREEINFYTTGLITDLANFIQLYRFENPSNLVVNTKPDNVEMVVTFQVQVPENTPLNDPIFLCILDEVTGLALNAKYYRMEELPVTGLQNSSDNSRYYSINLPLKIGSVVKYRYERGTENVRVAEHYSDGTPVRYRLLHVRASGKVEDISSTWADSEYTGKTGRIIGEAKDSETGSPIPNLLITVGGAQTLSNSNGSFVIEGLPPGTHNLVAYAIDGSFTTFQQGARIAPEATTPTPLFLTPSKFVDVTFSVSVPENTPPVIPVRLAGNLFQLGNTFSDLSGGVNTLAVRMPVLTKETDILFQITLSLPTGADIRYKYTLGDGFWNAEHDINGEFMLRQFIVPGKDIKVEDQIETWHSGGTHPVIFDPVIPDSTPEEDYVSIQFRPLFGWTEPIPMWEIGENRWAYILYSPLNLPGNFHYRYCRNSQCGTADDIATQGSNHEGRELVFENQVNSQSINDQIIGWTNYSSEIELSSPVTVTVNERGDGFWAGIEIDQKHHPSWMSKLPDAFNTISQSGANWVVLSPSWTFGSDVPGNNPPIFHQLPESNALWYDILDASMIADEIGMEVAHFPVAHFQQDQDEWWQNAVRDYSWWLIWFDQYKEFVLHHADLAQQAGAGAFILGGDWISPALPDAKFADGSNTGVPADSDNRWRELIKEVKARFDGELLWAHPANHLDSLPVFIDQFDHLYLQVALPEEEIRIDKNFTEKFQIELTDWLDNKVEPIVEQEGSSVILSVSIPAVPDLYSQEFIYQIVLNSINERDWIDGIVSAGFYPPAVLQDNSPSIHGKPAYFLISEWFPKFLGEESNLE